MQKRTKLNQKTSAILLITIAILFAEMGHAQTFTGTITGVVTDQAGALVADAQISLTSVATGEVREQRSNSDGRFNFASYSQGSTPCGLCKRASVSTNKHGFNSSPARPWKPMSRCRRERPARP